MCKILIAIKVNSSQNKKFERIIKAQENLLRKEPHGISALVVDEENNVSVKRELTNYDSVFLWVYKQLPTAKIVSIHSRQATDGDIDEDNVHFFKVGNYYMAHNGIIGKYSRYSYGYDEQREFFYSGNQSFKVIDPLKDDEDIISENPEVVNKELEVAEKEEEKKMSDSYEFLRNIPKPISKSMLSREIENSNFTGVGVIVDEKDKKMFVFSTRDIKAHTDSKNFIILYSYDPNTVLVNYQNIFGFRVVVGGKKEKLKNHIISGDIYEIKLKEIGKGR